jgi:hypothetical protein
MAENATYGYRTMLHTQGAAWVLMVNDIYVREAGDTQYADYTTNITTHLKAGTNTVSLLFSPIVGQDAATGEYIYELYDAVELDISIERSDYQSGATETVHPVRMKYDETAAGFSDREKTFGGEDRVMATPSMRVVGEMQFYELTGKDIVFDGGQAVGGYRLDITVEISDPIPGFHWEREAVTLEDTPEMRRSLREAYRRVHGTISRGDGEAIFREMEPIWGRTAALLTSKGSAREFIEGADDGLEQYQQSGPNGELQPLEFSNDPNGDQLQFMAQNRLVWIRPLKIYWVDETKSASHTLFPAVFYQRADGTWRIAAVLTGT